MKISKEGINLIKHFEGCRLTSYRDSVGVLTIGFGHTKGVKEGMIITESKAEELLKDDLFYFELRVLQLVKIPMTQNQFDALVSFTFNVGEGNFAKSNLLKRMNKVVYYNNRALESIADEFLKWNKARNPKTKKLEPLAGLTKRRHAERLMFINPIKINDVIAEIDALAVPRPMENIS